MQHQKYLYIVSKIPVYNIKHFFPIFYYNNQKEQAINLHQKYFHSYDTFYYNNQKEQAINLC